MSERIVADAYAWVEYLDGTKRGEKLKNLIETAVMRGNSTIVEANERLSDETGTLHAEMRRTVKDFGLSDAYVLATSRSLGARVLTGDPHFNGLKDAIML